MTINLSNTDSAESITRVIILFIFQSMFSQHSSGQKNNHPLAWLTSPRSSTKKTNKKSIKTGNNFPALTGSSTFGSLGVVALGQLIPAARLRIAVVKVGNALSQERFDAFLEELQEGHSILLAKDLPASTSITRPLQPKSAEKSNYSTRILNRRIYIHFYSFTDKSKKVESELAEMQMFRRCFAVIGLADSYSNVNKKIFAEEILKIPVFKYVIASALVVPPSPAIPSSPGSPDENFDSSRLDVGKFIHDVVERSWAGLESWLLKADASGTPHPATLTAIIHPPYPAEMLPCILTALTSSQPI